MLAARRGEGTVVRPSAVHVHARVQSMFSKRIGWGRTHAPLSVVCEDRVRLTECEEFLPGLGLSVHIRVELLAQLQSEEKICVCRERECVF